MVDKSKPPKYKRRLYRIWQGLKNRCFNPNEPCYKRYGARGITVCERWLIYENFEKDMTKGYKEGLQIDRINNDGDYDPNNCRWATREIQCNNRRSNRFITYKGTIKTLSQWAEYFNLKRSTVNQRFYVYKWGINKIFSPVYFERSVV